MACILLLSNLYYLEVILKGGAIGTWWSGLNLIIGCSDLLHVIAVIILTHLLLYPR